MNQPPEILHILHVLGDGGTTEMAQRVLAWTTQTKPWIPIHQIAGLAEIAAHTQQPETTIATWAKEPNLYFPKPATEIKASKLWDLDLVATWWQANKDHLLERKKYAKPRSKQKRAKNE